MSELTKARLAEIVVIGEAAQALRRMARREQQNHHELLAAYREQQEHIGKLQAMLRKHQWSSPESDIFAGNCPECGAFAYPLEDAAEECAEPPHAPGCELAALLPKEAKP